MTRIEPSNIGVAFPQRDIGADPAAVRDFAQAAEAMGFARLTFVDHVLGAGAMVDGDPAWTADYTVDNCIHEPLTLIAHIAALTERIGLLTSNIILPQRQAVLVAKQAAEIDILSGGRLILGVGLGWNRLEYDALGMDFETRGRRIGEQVAVMRRLWSEPSLTFDGEWHKFENGGLNPLPVQRPIPVWFGATVAPAIRRAAQIGDGWMVFPRFETRDEGRRMIDLFRDAATAAGRDPDGLVIDATEFWSGDADEWRSAAADWLARGATTLTFRARDTGAGSVDDQIAAMRNLAEG